MLEPPKQNRRSRKVLPRNGSVYRVLDQIENVIRYGDTKAQSQPDREKSIVEVKQEAAFQQVLPNLEEEESKEQVNSNNQIQEDNTVNWKVKINLS